MNLQPQFDRAIPTDAELQHIADRTEVLIRDINNTGNREAHVGIAAHALFLGLTIDERQNAMAHLHNVLRHSSN
jgi:hypothetical protein